MKVTTHILGALVAMLAATFTTTGHGNALINNFGLVSPAHVLTFDEIVFAEGALITNDYAAYGLSFALPTGMRYDAQGASVANFAAISGHYLGNFYSVIATGASIDIVNPFSIHFLTAQTNAAFGMATNPGTSTITALLGGSIVESFSTPTHHSDFTKGYYGFTETLFDEISISVSTQLALIDNIQTSSGVPEPTTLALLGLGLAGLGVSRRRQAATSRQSRQAPPNCR